MIKRKLFYSLPASLRFIVRRLYYLPQDLYNRLILNPPVLMPPQGMIYTGGGDFIETGNRFLSYFIKYSDLQPDAKVLDIGSGIGRMALPLTSYLNDRGSYEGFDVIKKGVNWCQENISSRFPNFKFTYIDLKNDLYKSTGDKASEFEFPYNNDNFDNVILISVFTHMSYIEVTHYLKEINRILKKGGKCFTTFFTYDETTKPIRSDFSFDYKYDQYALMDDKVKSANIAFERNNLKSIIISSGFTIKLINKGKWQTSDLNQSLDFQDVFVLEKDN